MPLDAAIKLNLYELEAKIKEYREAEAIAQNASNTPERRQQAQVKLDTLTPVIYGQTQTTSEKIKVLNSAATTAIAQPIALMDNSTTMTNYLKNINGGLAIANKLIPDLNNPSKLLDTALGEFARTGWGLTINIPRGSNQKEITLVSASDVINIVKSFTPGSTSALKPEDILAGLITKVEKEAFGFSVLELAKDFEKMQSDFNAGMASQKDIVNMVMNKMSGMLGIAGIPTETIQQINSFIKMGQGMLDVLTEVQTSYTVKTKSLSDRIKTPETTTTTTSPEGTTTTTVPQGTDPTTPLPTEEGALSEVDEPDNSKALSPEEAEAQYDAYFESEEKYFDEEQ